MKQKKALINALCTELELRKNEASNNKIQHIYFGGGTPSVCEPSEIEQILNTIYTNYSIEEQPEITLEANPDDLSEEKIRAFSKTKINRLSIGIQSFFEKDLQLMNRAHNATEALQSILLAKQYFENISIDLIYGIPNMSDNEWVENLKKTIDFNIPHISCYALTVEDKTALKTLIEKGNIPAVNDAKSLRHYKILIETFESAGYINYEFSNFGKKGFFSGNNTAYWEQKSYIGIGPSAHSFNGSERSWNISNNTKYLKNIQQHILPSEKETLSITDKYNEYIMTSLRTIWGVSLLKIKNDFNIEYATYFQKIVQKYLENGLISEKEDTFHLTSKGKFLGDGIASDLFFIPLEL